MAMTLSQAALVAAFSLAMAAPAAAEPQRREERIWTGTNGASFRGSYIDSIAQGGKIRFLTSAGKMVVVAFGNLSEADQKIIESYEGKAATVAETKTSAYDPDKFKELPAADRNLFPERNPHDFGGNDDESMVDALWVSLLWWNAFEVMPIPKSGDFDKKAAWLHEELTRYIAQRGRSATTTEEAKEGVEKYFSRHLEDIGACKVMTLADLHKNPDLKFKGLTPAGISELVKGNDIVILRFEMLYEDGKKYVECAALEKMDAAGNFSMHMYGKRLTGKMTVVPHPDPPKYDPKMQVQEFVVTDRGLLPENYQKEGARFFVGMENWADLLVVKPYVYKTEGEPAPLPAD